MKRLLLMAALCAFISAPAWAGLYTAVNAGSADEADLWEVLDVATNGSINVTQAEFNAGDPDARRVFDKQTAPGDVFDQFWRDGTVTVTATALWWGGSDAEGETGQDHQFMYDLLDGAGPQDLGPADWESGDWAQFDAGSSNPFIIGVDGKVDAWSLESRNSAVVGQNDRMVTVDVSGLDVYAWLSGTYDSRTTTKVRDASETGCAYIVAFDTGSDGDFQDFIGLIEGPCPVPVPGAVLLGVLGLGAAGAKLRRRRA